MFSLYLPPWIWITRRWIHCALLWATSWWLIHRVDLLNMLTCCHLVGIMLDDCTIMANVHSSTPLDVLCSSRSNLTFHNPVLCNGLTDRGSGVVIKTMFFSRANSIPWYHLARLDNHLNSEFGGS
ncbi:hypothetical protein SERLA73DRAFT_188194 [Serpula lacrymans var. lacrymans S7.3]|uniref:Uncharacterized protein n=1 Tax=Serpula lacrymans var. lacrymans (strain S7.3) TaxID=936435 RepID=F8QAW8_SERL3|nr:hypothetical protein SERLA73DRAFT_188194 [Serpula lacrymans var. lacrymans S7.3]